MLAFEFEQLSALGLTPALANRAAGLATSGSAPIELLRITGDSPQQHQSSTTALAERSARPLPRLVRALSDEGTALAVGDWVLAVRDAYGETWIEARVPPSSHIARRDGDGRAHPVVSNVDTALLLMGLDDDFNPRRLERYLALVRGDAIVPVVVLTKADVAAPSADELDRRLALLDGRVPPGVEVFAVNALDVSAARALRGYLGRGQTLVLLGSSGAGKSTLTNTLARRRRAGHRARARARQSRQAHDDVEVAAPAAGRRLRDRHAGPAHAASRMPTKRRSPRRSTTSQRSPRSADFATAHTREEPGCAVREGDRRRPPAQLPQAACARCAATR